MKKSIGRKGALAASAAWLIWTVVMYYLLLPAWNLHSVGLWLFLLLVMLLPACIIAGIYQIVVQAKGQTSGKFGPMLFGATGMLGILFLVILLFGSRIFHAKSYAKILTSSEYDFTEDIDQSTAVSSIALMDTDSAILLGNREIGSLSEVVSQYNVSESYSQIALNGAPLKVSALNYAGIFKYFGNKENGVPGYVQVDPVGQNAEYVALEKNMYYVPSAYFGEDLRRKLRMTYPTKIFGNTHFEIDEEGNPYYVSAVYRYTIGLFGGETVEGAIVLNPVDGSSSYYKLSDIPNWVDDVFDGDLLVEQYDWYGKLSNGFLNSIFGKKGCKKCTETVSADSDSDDSDDESYAPDYGYVAKDGDIWIYTGITSVNDDASNIGFLLVNERTGEAHVFNVSGADESSAMAAAEGEVQEKGYVASFPSLINVDNQPTYVMVLKDASGIVKLYAMVNVESYNVVTTASTLDECFSKYRKMIGTGETEENQTENTEDVSTDEGESYSQEDLVEKEFTIQEIRYVDVDGSTYVYLMAEDGSAYKQKFSQDETLLFLQVGDTVKVQCLEAENGIATIVERK